jgi:hypothetical protein
VSYIKHLEDMTGELPTLSDEERAAMMQVVHRSGVTRKLPFICQGAVWAFVRHALRRVKPNPDPEKSAKALAERCDAAWHWYCAAWNKQQEGKQCE